MRNTLKLLLPAIIPSWRFFDIIAPSPRIQFALLDSENDPPLAKRQWREFRPRPTHLSFLQMLGRMFWNPERNESLFMVSCAEHILQQPTQHSEDEILKRIIAELRANNINRSVAVTHVQFRLLLIQRQNARLRQQVVFRSRIQPLPTQNAI